MTSIVTAQSLRCFRHWPAWLVISWLAIAGALTASAQAPGVLPNYDSYYPGEDIVVSFSNGPGNLKDWIGIYPEGAEPGPVQSTLWFYVDNTDAGRTGYKEGSVIFTGGLNLAGLWYVYFFENDIYTKLATNQFFVVDPSSPLVRPNKRTYTPSEPISLTFTNGPGLAKDWIGIYQEGQIPGGGPLSTLWAYVDGTDSGTIAKTEGTITFAQGLTQVGHYVAYLLADDGYYILTSNRFSVAEATSLTPRLLTLSPANNSSNLSPVVAYMAEITNGATKVVTNTVVLTIDGVLVPRHVTQAADLVTITYTNATLYAPGSTHTARLVFADNAVPPNPFTNEVTFTVAQYRNIVLPDPLYFENFDNTPEGELPPGWTQTNYTEVTNPEMDFGNLDSAVYATWVGVNADRFRGSFITYSDPNRSLAEQEDYHRVLSINPLNVVNGQVLNEPLAKGRFLFSDSGYRNGRSQVAYAFTPDFNLAGQTNIYLSFHSLWEQNQDSLAAVEYSVDQGTNWLPIVYLLDGPDVLTQTNEITGEVTVDAVTTFNTSYVSVARYFDEQGVEQGGTYGAFIAAPISQDLAPYISARVDDDAVGSKRVELFRLPQADNQAKVRFRFAHAGSDSWYFGIDDFGLYSIRSAPVTPPRLAITRSGVQAVISWPAEVTGFTLESTASLSSPSWNPESGVINNSFTVTPSAAAAFYQLRKP